MPSRTATVLAILAAALGYFVDAYDLILYNIVRVDSLRGLGVPESRSSPRWVWSARSVSRSWCSGSA